jgi:protein-tyrosine phosphatase
MSRQIELSLAAPQPVVRDPETPRVDVHSHLVPAVDDGARDLDEAVAAVDRMVAAGVTRVLTTPHIDASVIARPDVFERVQRSVETAWHAVMERCRECHPTIELYLGREVMLDVAAPEFDDARVRLNGGRYVLVEFPRLNIPPGAEDVLYHVVARGQIPVVAHVERYFYHGDEERALEEWRHAGALLQVNAPSLLGKYGPVPRAFAWELLSRGWVDLLASDYHARGETWLLEARDALVERGGEEQERILMGLNPRHVLMDETVEDVPPLALADSRADRWSRLRRIFGGGSYSSG